MYMQSGWNTFSKKNLLGVGSMYKIHMGSCSTHPKVISQETKRNQSKEGRKSEFTVTINTIKMPYFIF